jgi:TonB-linked SusC/RagA family outer membrane protein
MHLFAYGKYLRAWPFGALCAGTPKHCLKAATTRSAAMVVKVMKITALILLTACLHAAAAGHAQKMISLSERNAPVQKIFNEIRKQTGYQFLYANQVIASAKKVTIEVKNASLEEVLQTCFKDQPLEYEIKDKVIIVRPKTATNTTPAATATDNAVPPVDIKGRIVNDKGEPVSGATITIKGTNRSTITNANGEFSLSDVNENAVLEVTHVQYDMQLIPVKGKSMVNATMSIKVGSLDETVVIAYGTTTKRLNTGNVSSVKAKDIEMQPVNNFLLALQGRVPGLFITQSNGLSGGAVTVRLQGQNSILNGNDPLYVIDGVPYTSQLLSTTTGGPLGSSGAYSSNGTALKGNPLSYLNPNDIESVEILKDADATAIYGSRAANGAILITTKKGKAGTIRVNVSYQEGWGKITKKVDLLNTQQYLEMRHEAFGNDNAMPQEWDYDVSGFWDTTRYTDWQKILIGGTARYSDVNLTASGGSGNTQYLIGGTFHRQTTVFPGNFNDKKGAVHFNINSQSSNQRLSLMFTGNYMMDNNFLPQNDLTPRAISLVPDAPKLYNADGSLNWMQDSTGYSTWYNPISDLNNTYRNKTNNLIGNLTVSFKILPGLEVKSSFGYNNLQTSEFSPSPLVSYKPEQRPTYVRSAIYTNSNISTWIVEPQLLYRKDIHDSKLEFLVGSTIQQSNNNGQGLYAEGFNSDAVLKNITSATMVIPFGSEVSEYKYNALFGRLNYNIANKYLININSRRDGSSRFGPKNQFHNFWSIAGGWIFTQEEFAKKLLPILSYGKFRASYGTTGNDQIGDYSYLNLYSSIGDVAVPYQATPGLTINGLYNPFLQWEETKKMQAGLDLSFARERVIFSVNYVHNRSSNQLLGYALPIIAGFYTINRNFPAVVQNTAWEISLSTTNISTRDFKWTSNFNITVPRNKLISFENLSRSSYSNSLIVGQPITILKVYRSAGVNDTSGIYQFIDGKGGTTYSPSFLEDRTVIINRSPKYYGGIENSFSYKGFRLDFLLQFVKQIGLAFRNNFIPGVYIGGSINGYNQPVSVLNRWRQPGDKSSVERFSSDYKYASANSYFAGSDAAYTDASFIRLKNVSLSWDFPKATFQKMHIQDFRVFVHAQNALTITKYKGMDPENQSAASMSVPPLKVVTVGLQLGL